LRLHSEYLQVSVSISKFVDTFFCYSTNTYPIIEKRNLRTSSMIKFTFKQEDFETWLKGFSKTVGVKAVDNYLVIPPSIGAGYIYSRSINKSLSYVVMDFELKKDLNLNRMGTSDFGILLYFNQVDVTEFFKVVSQQEMIKEQTKLRRNIFLSSTNTDLEVTFSKGSHMRRVGIYFAPAMIRRFIKKDAKIYLTSYTQNPLLNVNKELIGFEYRKILDEIYKTDFNSDISLLILHNRILLLTEKFFQKLLARSISSDNKINKLNRADLDALETVERALSKEELEKFPSITKLSTLARMSTSKLKNKFKEVYGMKLYEFYNKNRLQKAREWIEAGDTSVKEAAYKVGFSSLSNFSKAFKKEFGLLPKELKQ